MIVITSEPDLPRFFHIYEPPFSVMFLAEDLPEDLRAGSTGWITATSKHRIEVDPGDTGIEWLVRELAQLDARNLPRDRVFADKTVKITLAVSNSWLVPTKVTIR